MVILNTNEDNVPPTPPKHFYKFLSAARVGDVLEDGMVRFTPLTNTNDTFEVRSTFEKFAGPQFRAMLSKQITELWTYEYLKKIASGAEKGPGLEGIPPTLVLKILESNHNKEFLDLMKKTVGVLLESLALPVLNNADNMQIMLEKFGRQFLCFSLSERMDSSPMWAHYSDGHQGFIIAFDSDHSWFKSESNPQKTRAQKVTYFDGKIEEPLVNPQAAFISKTKAWEYEREWRIYISEEKADEVIYKPDNPNDPIHLVKFPPEAVDRIILGKKIKPEIAERIHDAVSTRYPHARIFRASPNPKSHTYDEVPE